MLQKWVKFYREVSQALSYIWEASILYVTVYTSGIT